MTLTPTLAAEYASLFETCAIRPEKLPEVDVVVSRMIRQRPHYRSVHNLMHVPWFVVAAIHQMESGGNLKTHLHNGDPLTARTVQVPKGRPLKGDPPFTWEASAIDAIKVAGLDKVEPWTIARTCFELEKFNGWGYRKRGIHTPYLWAGSQHYVKGKYVADGKWSFEAVSKQIGAAVLLVRLRESDFIEFAEAA